MAERAQTSTSSRSGLSFPFRNKLNVRRPGPITALDLDGPLLRVAETAPRGSGTEITGLAVGPLPLPPDADRSDPAVLGKAIAKALVEMRVRPGLVVMGVPRHLVVLRTLALPAIKDTRELASMVHLQIGKDLPFRVEEAVIDFQVRAAASRPPETEEPNREAGSPEASRNQPSPASEKIEVLVAAIRRESVEFYQKTAAAAKLRLVGLGWLSQANARCIEACGLTEGNEAVALISLRPNEVAIDITAQHSLLFSRGASTRANAEAGPEPEASEQPAPISEQAAEPIEAGGPPEATFVNAVTIEVVRSLHSYGGIEREAPVSKLLVVGATGQESLVVQALQDRLRIPCRLLDPGEALDLPKPLREHAAGAIGVLGLGLGVNDPEGLPFDFLSPKRPAVQRNTRRIRTLAYTAAGVILFICVMAFRSHLIRQHQSISDKVKAELTEAEKKRSIYRRMQVQAATISNWAKGGRDWLEQYAYLSAILPSAEDLYITSLTVGGQGNIHMAVQARSGEILATLDRQLRAAGYDVKPLAITPAADRAGYNFRSTVELSLTPRLKIDLSKAQPPARPADDASLDSKAKAPRKERRP